jgi:Tfp pilus assembly protein PilN
MRPVDLIPAEQRQGAHAPMRTGSVPYILLGALVAALAAVALLVITGNQISEQKSEVVKLKREDAAAQEQASRLSAYVQFQRLHEQRVATISSLADSRFDWERVMRELSLVLPHDVWLTNLKAFAGGGGTEAGPATAIAGPSLELSGCATGQEAVAGFVTTLKDIDGVTRVGVSTSALAAAEEGGGGSTSSQSADSGCQTRSFIAQFQVIVAFDAAPMPLTGAEGEAAVATTETAEPTESSESESPEGG